jgi:hypothetical protein
MIWLKAFLSGFFATLIFHQGLFTLFWLSGVVPMAPYNVSPVPPFGVPAVISLSFFGGLWGILIGVPLRKMSGAAKWLAHLAAGALGPTVVAMLVVFPLKDIDVTAKSWVGGLLLNGFWGIGLALGMRLGTTKTPSPEQS